MNVLLFKYLIWIIISIKTSLPSSASVIHWTRQIKEVLSAQDALEMSENSGPLEEIAFWKSRCTDLSGISKQLDQDGVTGIKEILTLSKSSYIAPFSKLAKQIQDNTAQAQSNLKFLSALKEPCEDLANAEPAAIPPMLPKVNTTNQRTSPIVMKQIATRCTAYNWFWLPYLKYLTYHPSGVELHPYYLD